MDEIVGLDRAHLLRKFLAHLKNHDVAVIVLSINLRIVIVKVLKAAGIYGFIDYIYDRMDLCRMTGHKRKQVRTCMAFLSHLF